MSGCTPRSAETTTVPRMATSKPTAKQSSVPINVTTHTRTTMPYQRGERAERAVSIRSAFMLLVLTLDPLGAPSPECMDGPGSTFNFTAMDHTARDVVFLSGLDGYPLRADDQRVASLHHDHVFVELMHMSRRCRRLATSPECHLAPLCTIKHIPFAPWSCLAAAGNPGWPAVS